MLIVVAQTSVGQIHRPDGKYAAKLVKIFRRKLLPELKDFFLKTYVVRSSFLLVACKSVCNYD